MVPRLVRRGDSSSDLQRMLYGKPYMEDSRCASLFLFQVLGALGPERPFRGLFFSRPCVVSFEAFHAFVLLCMAFRFSLFSVTNDIGSFFNGGLAVIGVGGDAALRGGGDDVAWRGS